jgi:hypothetical protein
MQYLKPTFSLPAAPSRITQQRWDEIFGSVENKEVSDPQIAPGFDMSAPRRFGISESDRKQLGHVVAALAHMDGWESDGQMAGGSRQSV